MSRSHTSPSNELTGLLSGSKAFPTDIPSSEQSSGVPTPEFATTQSNQHWSPRYGYMQPVGSPQSMNTNSNTLNSLNSSRTWSAHTATTNTATNTTPTYDFTSLQVTHGSSDSLNNANSKRDKTVLPLNTPMYNNNTNNNMTSYTPPVVPLTTPPLSFPKRDSVLNPMQPMYQYQPSANNVMQLNKNSLTLAQSRTYKSFQQMLASILLPSSQTHHYFRSVELNGVFTSIYHGLMLLQGDSTPLACPFFLLELYNPSTTDDEEEEVTVQVYVVPKSGVTETASARRRVQPQVVPQTPAQSTEIGLSLLNNLEFACAANCMRSIPNMEQQSLETGRRKRQRVCQWTQKPLYTYAQNAVQEQIAEYVMTQHVQGVPALGKKQPSTHNSWIQAVIGSCTNTAKSYGSFQTADYMSPVFSQENMQFYPQKDNSTSTSGAQSQLSPVSSFTLPLTPKQQCGTPTFTGYSALEQKSDYPVQPTKVRSQYSNKYTGL